MSPILGKSATDFRKNQPQTLRNLSPTLGKSVTDFGKIRHRFWGNQPLTLGKSVTDFGEICHRLSGNQPPTFGKFRFWEKQFPFLGKTCSVFGKKPSPSLGRTGSVFGTKWFRFGKESALFTGGIGSVLDWFGTKLKSHCFER